MLLTHDNIGHAQNKYIAYDDETITVDGTVKTLTMLKITPDCVAVHLGFMEGPSIVTMFSAPVVTPLNGREYSHGGEIWVNDRLARTIQMTRMGSVNGLVHVTYYKNL